MLMLPAHQTPRHVSTVAGCWTGACLTDSVYHVTSPSCSVLSYCTDAGPQASVVASQTLARHQPHAGSLNVLKPLCQAGHAHTPLLNVDRKGPGVVGKDTWHKHKGHVHVLTDSLNAGAFTAPQNQYSRRKST